VTDTDIAALLRALAEQQTALLAAHAASMRVQGVLIERLTSSGAVAGPPECAPTPTNATTNTSPEDHLVVESVAPAAARDSSAPLDRSAEVPVDTSAEPELVAAEPPAVTEEGGRPATSASGYGRRQPGQG
jgi:hypothetical protein